MKYLLLPLSFYFSIGLAAQQCPIDQLTQYTWANAVVGDEIQVDADDSDVSENTATFTGHVVAKRGQEIFYADKITYQRDSGNIQTPKNITYGTPDFAIRADNAHYSLQSENGSFYGLDYYLTKNAVNGEAKQLDIDRKANTEELTEASYSTCPRLSRAWSIQAKKIHLDHDRGIGQTWDTTFHLGNVTVFYFPYFSFPLDDRRKTGFLVPSVSLSKQRGADVLVPYYINIAPNQDATLYPRLMTKRGLMLGGQYRYLLPKWTGSVAATYLSEDWKIHKKRWSFNTQHQYRPNNRFFLSTRYQRVSDKNYIEDFEEILDLSNVNFLQSHLSATYLVTPHFRLSGEIKDYQVANSRYVETDKPYSVLPRLSGKGDWQLDNGFTLRSDSEITHFDKTGAVSGWRFDQAITGSYAMERTYGFIKPSATYRITHYQLDNQKAGTDDTHTRLIPTFSVDSGLYFDRQMTWLGKSATQSLEPRLFYLRTPYRKQSDLPDFDTSLVDSSYDAMFLNNRFIGKDRIGDANQLTTAVSSTLTDNKTGKELATIAIGQIQYFADRRVSLLNKVANQSRSSVIGEGRAQITNDLRLRGLVHYDTDGRHLEKSLAGIIYAPALDQSISLSHLYDQNYYKQIDFSGVWRLNDAWRTFWRWNYSIEYDKTIDAIAGIEYADCCWGLRLITRQHRNSLTSNKSPEITVYLEFALKGLGNVGNNTTTMLRDVVPNYRPISYEKPQ